MTRQLNISQDTKQQLLGVLDRYYQDRRNFKKQGNNKENAGNQAIQELESIIRGARLHEHQLLQHQTKNILKSASAMVGWSELRVEQIKGGEDEENVMNRMLQEVQRKRAGL